MSDEKRDDTKLRSLICPHCQHTLPVLMIQAFKQQQLLFMRCEMCGKGITQQQITDTYREYESKGNQS